MLFILVTFVVSVAITPEFTKIGSDKPAHYAKCPSGTRNDGSESIESKLKLLFFVVYGYIIRSLKLLKSFDDAPRRMSSKLRLKSIQIQTGFNEILAWDTFKSCSAKERIKILFFTPFQIALYRLLHLYLDILTSFLAEVRAAHLPFTRIMS